MGMPVPFTGNSGKYAKKRYEPACVTASHCSFHPLFSKCAICAISTYVPCTLRATRYQGGRKGCLGRWRWEVCNRAHPAPISVKVYVGRLDWCCNGLHNSEAKTDRAFNILLCIVSRFAGCRAVLVEELIISDASYQIESIKHISSPRIFFIFPVLFSETRGMQEYILHYYSIKKGERINYSILDFSRINNCILISLRINYSVLDAIINNTFYISYIPQLRVGKQEHLLFEFAGLILIQRSPNS